MHQNPDEELTFWREGEELVSGGGQVAARLPGIDAEEYPPLPSVTELSSFSIPVSGFIEALKQVVIACAQDQGRPVLTGVSCNFSQEETVLAATDSFRLVERTLGGVTLANPIQVLLPVRTAQELIRIVAQIGLDVQLEVSVGENQMVLRLKDVELYSRLLTGVFPKYQAIIPKHFVATAQVGVQQFSQALRLATIFASSGVANVIIEVDAAGTLNLSSHASQRGGASHTLPAVVESGAEPVRAAFNTRFLLDAVGATAAETVELKFSGPTSPLVIATGEPDYVQLVMPIRLDA